MACMLGRPGRPGWGERRGRCAKLDAAGLEHGIWLELLECGELHNGNAASRAAIKEAAGMSVR